MERDIRINWNAIVETAVRQRKELNLTQKRLAAIAGVSTPTISRFENGSSKIELGSAFAILDALGLKADVQFFNNEHWDFDKGAVSFSGLFKQQQYQCYVSMEAMMDNLVDRSDQQNMVKAVKRHRKIIQTIIQDKILAGKYDEDNVVVLKSRELADELAAKSGKRRKD